MYFNKTYYYYKKNLKPLKFADNECHEENNEFFAHSINISDSSKPTPELNIISCKSFKTYYYFNKLCSLLSLSNIWDLIRNKNII